MSDESFLKGRQEDLSAEQPVWFLTHIGSSTFDPGRPETVRCRLLPCFTRWCLKQGHEASSLLHRCSSPPWWVPPELRGCRVPAASCRGDAGVVVRLGIPVLPGCHPRKQFFTIPRRFWRKGVPRFAAGQKPWLSLTSQPVHAQSCPALATPWTVAALPWPGSSACGLFQA